MGRWNQRPARHGHPGTHTGNSEGSFVANITGPDAFNITTYIHVSVRGRIALDICDPYRTDPWGGKQQVWPVRTDEVPNYGVGTARDITLRVAGCVWSQSHFGVVS